MSRMTALGVLILAVGTADTLPGCRVPQAGGKVAQESKPDPTPAAKAPVGPTPEKAQDKPPPALFCVLDANGQPPQGDLFILVGTLAPVIIRGYLPSETKDQMRWVYCTSPTGKFWIFPDVAGEVLQGGQGTRFSAEPQTCIYYQPLSASRTKDDMRSSLWSGREWETWWTPTYEDEK